ncbi:MAG: acyltransferase family protein [Candidatus Baltobacteraceae bacterium]
MVYPFIKALLNGDAAPSWGQFAYRRGIKIVPSYILSIVLLIAIGYAQFSSPRDMAVSVIAHLLFVHTWFSATYGSINGVLWTLAVEVEFYAVFPLIWFVFKRLPYVMALALIAFSIGFRSYALACCLHTFAPLMIDNLPGYLDTFACGMLAAYLYVRYREQLRGTAAKAAATAVALGGFVWLASLLHGLWLMRAAPDWSTVWQIGNRTLVAAAFVMMALGSLLAFSWWQRTVANPVLLFLAVISYNLYLYHQALARLLLKWHIPPFTGASEHADAKWPVPYTFVAFAATIAWAAFIAFACERPLLRIKLEQWRGLLSRRGREGALPPA